MFAFCADKKLEIVLTHHTPCESLFLQTDLALYHVLLFTQ